MGVHDERSSKTSIRVARNGMRYLTQMYPCSFDNAHRSDGLSRALETEREALAKEQSTRAELAARATKLQVSYTMPQY